MKLTLLILWLSVPVLWAAWHYGPGQEALKLDKSDAALAAATAALSREDSEAAIASYDEALAALPKEATAQAYRIRLARCQAQLSGQQLPEANRDLEILRNDLTADPGAPAGLLNGTEEALANTGYYMTWLMRLEGQPREFWEPEIEKSRQNFRRLAETGSSTDKERYQKNLENALRLAQMDLTELQGLPLPKQCKNCKSGRCNNPGKKVVKQPTDSRKAGGGPPADGEGS